MTNFSRMTFREQVDKDKAKILLSYDNEALRDKLFPLDRVDNENGADIYSPDNYVKCLKRWLKRILKDSNTVMDTEYKYSTNLKTCGRIYVKGFGVQSLKGVLRGYLVKDYYDDYDMKNCHPTLLLWLMKRYFPALPRAKLTEYVNNRKVVLERESLQKTQIIISMYMSKPIKTSNQFLKDLDKEFKIIQNTLFTEKLTADLEKYEILKGLKKKNAKASFLSVVLDCIENDILQKASQLYEDDVCVPMFDGFLMRKGRKEEDVIKKLNNMSREYGIEWVRKDHDDGFEPHEDEYQDRSMNYDVVKADFEKEHLMIMSPCIFIREKIIDGKRSYYCYNRNDFMNVVAPYKYCEYNADGERVEHKFFGRWLEDPKRRHYDTIEFIPKKEVRNNVYNTFNGFEITDETECVYDENAVKIFTDHIDFLVGYESEAKEYVIKYLAHLIQKPYELPAVALLFKSKQGFGKDKLLDIVSSILGKDYLHRTANVEDIFGNFNADVKDKLIIQLNELEGKDGFSNKEKLKNFITETSTSINDKNVKKYTQNNYSRVIIMSNNAQPVEIPVDDRRFAVFQSHFEKPSSEYFKNLVDIEDDKNKLASIHRFLSAVKLSNFDLRNRRPKTKAYKEMRTMNQNPFYPYLLSNFEGDKYKNTFISSKTRKGSGDVYVKSKDLLDTYREHLYDINETWRKIDFKQLRVMLMDLSIEKKQVKIDGVNNDYYIINRVNLLERLKAMNIVCKNEELTCDDFE